VLRLFPLTRWRKVAGAAPVGAAPVGVAVVGVAVVGAAAVGAAAAAAVKSGFLRLRRRAVAAAVGAAEVGAAPAGAAAVGVAVVGVGVAGMVVVGMAAVGVVGNFCIKKAGRLRNQFLRSSATRRLHQVMGHRPRNSLTSPNKWGRTERPPSLETSMLIGEQLRVIMAIVSRM
jgi:hypothetical protein